MKRIFFVLFFIFSGPLFAVAPGSQQPPKQNVHFADHQPYEEETENREEIFALNVGSASDDDDLEIREITGIPKEKSEIFSEIILNENLNNLSENTLIQQGLEFIQKLRIAPENSDYILPRAVCNGIMRTALALYIYQQKCQIYSENTQETIKYMVRKIDGDKIYLAQEALFKMFPLDGFFGENRAKIFALYKIEGATKIYKTLISFSILRLLQDYFFRDNFDQEKEIIETFLTKEYSIFGSMTSKRSVLRSSKNETLYQKILSSMTNSLFDNHHPAEYLVHEKAIGIITDFQAKLKANNHTESELFGLIEKISHMRSMRSNYDNPCLHPIVKLLNISSLIHHTAMLRASNFIKWEYEVHTNTKIVFSNSTTIVIGVLSAILLIINTFFSIFSSPYFSIDSKIYYAKGIVIQFIYDTIAIIGFYGFLKYKYGWY